MDNLINLNNLIKSEQYLVPHIFTQNYFNILKLKLQNKELSENQRYYYNHFIKKKIEAMTRLFDINNEIHGMEFIKPSRLKKASELLKKYSRKHKNMKILISGSFLYNNRYSDIDIFIISKYDKEDYRDGKVHVNYIPESSLNTVFFHSISQISIANFKFNKSLKESFSLGDILHLYELVILLILQKDDFLQELRDLLIRIEYISSQVILSSLQLKHITSKILKSKDPIKLIGKYIVAKVMNSYSDKIVIETLTKFIKKNTIPRKNKKMYKNWQIYNEMYKEGLEIVT